MITKVFDYIKKYRMIQAGDTIVAGVSGGADSVCLLFMLLKVQKEIPFHMIVVHVNHGIRIEAKQDAAYVQQLCKERDIPFVLIEEDVKVYAKSRGLSEEEAGRKIRYDAFEAAAKGGKIAVAHNANDRAETMLFHLFRGTGLTGAGGIRPVNGNVIRPLLCLQRKEIEAWLEEQEIPYCMDHTNAQDIYTRNRIRHHILPYAEEEICSGAIEHMNQTADQLLLAETFIKKQTDDARKRCTVRISEQEKTIIKINLQNYFQEDEYLQGRILLSCLEDLTVGRKDITAVHIRNMQKLFRTSGSRQIRLPQGIIVYKEYDMGMIYKEDHEQNHKQNNSRVGISKIISEYAVTIPGKLEVPGLGTVEFTVFPYKKSENIPLKTYTKWFDYDKITKSIRLRTRKSGDYLTINSRMDRKSLQDYFVNEKVPKAERDCFYVLANEAHIMWVLGYRISEYYKVTDKTRTILEVKVMHDNYTGRKES